MLKPVFNSIMCASQKAATYCHGCVFQGRVMHVLIICPRLYLLSDLRIPTATMIVFSSDLYCPTRRKLNHSRGQEWNETFISCLPFMSYCCCEQKEALWNIYTGCIWNSQLSLMQWDLHSFSIHIFKVVLMCGSLGWIESPWSNTWG